MDTTRISDAEREHTAGLLRTAVGEGRLDLAEYDERLRSTYVAVTKADLARIPTTCRRSFRPPPRRARPRGRANGPRGGATGWAAR